MFFLFVSLDLVLVLEKEVDVVTCVHQAVFLVAVDVETLRFARSEAGAGLVRHIDLDLGLRVVLDGREEFGEELLAYHHR